MSFNDLLINDKKFWVVFISNFLDIICSVILFFTDIFRTIEVLAEIF